MSYPCPIETRPRSLDCGCRATSEATVTLHCCGPVPTTACLLHGADLPICEECKRPMHEQCAVKMEGYEICPACNLIDRAAIDAARVELVGLIADLAKMSRDNAEASLNGIATRLAAA